MGRVSNDRHGFVITGAASVAFAIVFVCAAKCHHVRVDARIGHDNGSV